MAINRILSGIENGAFYAKGSKTIHPKIKKYVNNYHFIETPRWYAMFGSLFFLIFAILKLKTPEYEFDILCQQILATLLLTMGSSHLGGLWYQIWINRGSGLPDIDPNENPMSEFAFWRWSFWWKRPFYGKRRKLLPLIGIIFIIVGYLLIP